MRIADEARKHGIRDDDMLHAARNAIREITMDDGLTMLLGPASSAALLGVGVLDIEEDPAIIHAMPIRSRFFELLA